MISLWLLLACSSKDNASTIPQSNSEYSGTTDTNDGPPDTPPPIEVDTATVDTGQVDTGPSDTDSNDAVMVMDFNLPDINPVSATFSQNYSPRDYLQKVSGWYFIKGT